VGGDDDGLDDRADPTLGQAKLCQGPPAQCNLQDTSTIDTHVELPQPANWASQTPALFYHREPHVGKYVRLRVGDNPGFGPKPAEELPL
jgi:hypothetical protein